MWMAYFICCVKEMNEHFSLALEQVLVRGKGLVVVRAALLQHFPTVGGSGALLQVLFGTTWVLKSYLGSCNLPPVVGFVFAILF